MCNNQFFKKVPFIISQPLTGFDIFKSLATGQVGFKSLIVHRTFQSPRFLTNVLFHPYHLDPGSVA